MDLLDDIFAGGASKTGKEGETVFSFKFAIKVIFILTRLSLILLFHAVKAGGKFQPKAKPRPVKKGPAVASSSLTSKPTGDTVATDYSEGFKSAKNSQNC